jgi:uncharacterized lipoprotein YddW (UPF0748 family)
MKPVVSSLCLLIALAVPGCGPDPEAPAAAQPAPLAAVRGAWLTTTDSRVLDSRANIEAAIANCESLGLNALFVVVWGQGMTNYPSQVMRGLTGTEINPRFAGRDPLRELIEVAKPRGIKVFAWFEYGFAASFSANGGPVVRARPQWAAIGTDNRLVVKNGFDWLNALHPEVQEFMRALVLEVVRNYEVDGIQGDDRLPAMPVEGGYDSYTVGQYRAEHSGQAPPTNFRDPAWVRWRANRLNEFARVLYREAKAARRGLIVSYSPSVFPFSRDEYLQDWPQWLADDAVDLLVPQVYRRDLASYAATLRSNVALVPANKQHRLVPGVLIKVGAYQPTEQLLGDMLAENRRLGFSGEVFFFYEGLAQYRQAFQNQWYQDKAVFPSF